MELTCSSTPRPCRHWLAGTEATYPPAAAEVSRAKEDGPPVSLGPNEDCRQHRSMESEDGWPAYIPRPQPAKKPKCHLRQAHHGGAELKIFPEYNDQGDTETTHAEKNAPWNMQYRFLVHPTVILYLIDCLGLSCKASVQFSGNIPSLRT